jgi:hypothetical protein
MGNLVNKEITKDDICFDYIVKELIEKNNYKLIETDNPLLVSKSITENVVLKIGDLYCSMIERDYSMSEDIKRMLLSPFVNGLCIGSYINKDYAVSSILDDKYIFFVGFSHFNFCKVISFSSCDLTVVFGDTIPIINSVCAIKPSQYVQEELDNKKIKLNLGMITIYKCIQYFKEKGYKYVILECHHELIEYYMKIYFNIGRSPKTNYRSCIRQNHISTIQNIIRMSDHYERKSNSLDQLYVGAYFGSNGDNPLKELDNLLFYLYFDIDMYFNKLKKEIDIRLINAYKAYNIKRIYDYDNKEDIASLSKRFLQTLSSYDIE